MKYLAPQEWAQIVNIVAADPRITGQNPKRDRTPVPDIREISRHSFGNFGKFLGDMSDRGIVGQIVQQIKTAPVVHDSGGQPAEKRACESLRRF